MTRCCCCFPATLCLFIVSILVAVVAVAKVYFCVENSLYSPDASNAVDEERLTWDDFPWYIQAAVYGDAGVWCISPVLALIALCARSRCMMVLTVLVMGAALFGAVGFTVAVVLNAYDGEVLAAGYVPPAFPYNIIDKHAYHMRQFERMAVGIAILFIAFQACSLAAACMTQFRLDVLERREAERLAVERARSRFEKEQQEEQEQDRMSRESVRSTRSVHSQRSKSSRRSHTTVEEY